MVIFLEAITGLMEAEKLRPMEMKMSGDNDYGCEEPPLILAMVVMAPVKDGTRDSDAFMF